MTENTHIVFHMSNFIQFPDFFLFGKNPENLISGLFLVGFLFEKRPCATRQKTRFFTKYNRNNDHQTKRIMD